MFAVGAPAYVIDLANEESARWAEVIFASGAGKANFVAMYDDIKGRMAKYGRPREHCAILPSINVVVVPAA